MSLLHTVNSRDALPRCQRVIEPGDTLVLIEDGVYLALTAEAAALAAQVTLLALADDLAARGLTDRVASGTAIDLAQLVQLCCDHQKVINWF